MYQMPAARGLTRINTPVRPLLSDVRAHWAGTGTFRNASAIVKIAQALDP